MKSHLSHVGPCLLAVTALALGGCGGSGEPDGEKLPPGLSQEMIVEIDRIQDRVDAGVAGACDDIFEQPDGGSVQRIGQLLAEVPRDVDPEIRSALSDSVDRLQQLVTDECEQIRAREQEDQDVVEDEPVIEDTTEETTTTPPETDTAPDTETSPEPPPVDPDDEDEGNGQSNGQGPDGTGPSGQDDGGGVEAPGL